MKSWPLPTVFLCLSFVCFSSIDLIAQGRGFKRQNRFKAGLTLGLNMSQIDGDNYQGFRRPGIQGGLVGIAVLNRNNILSTELLFSQRGSRPSNKEIKRMSEYRVKIRLNYVEVPFLYHHLFNEREDGSFGHNYHVGFSFARLVGTRIEESSFNAYYQPRQQDSIIKSMNNIRKNDLSLIAGATFYFNKFFGLTFRCTMSLTPFYTPEETSSLRSYYLTFGGNYFLH